MGKKKNRNVGIVGIGQTEYSSHKENQNQVEMVNEAVRLALEDANFTATWSYSKWSINRICGTLLDQARLEKPAFE